MKWIPPSNWSISQKLKICYPVDYKALTKGLYHLHKKETQRKADTNRLSFPCVSGAVTLSYSVALVRWRPHSIFYTLNTSFSDCLINIYLVYFFNRSTYLLLLHFNSIPSRWSLLPIPVISAILNVELFYLLTGYVFAHQKIVPPNGIYISHFLLYQTRYHHSFV